jgi:hypothetical protein
MLHDKGAMLRDGPQMNLIDEGEELQSNTLGCNITTPDLKEWLLKQSVIFFEWVGAV